MEILALPVAGPWMEISDALSYAKTLKPKVVFPVHDGGLKSPGTAHRVPSAVLPPLGIKFIVPEENKEIEF